MCPWGADRRTLLCFRPARIRQSGRGGAPWAVRNYQTFGEPILVSDSAWLHLWMGNNPGATGAEMDNADMDVALGRLDKADAIPASAPGRWEKLHLEPLQNKRYKMLA